MTIRIVTDSTADVTPAIAQTYGITVVPLSVTFDDDKTVYRDNIDLDNETFYAKLQVSSKLPRTSQPSPAAFQEAYTHLINEGADGIISIHLSDKLSGTYQSACTAYATLPDDLKKVPIEIINSQTVSVGTFLGLKRAAHWAEEGMALEDIKKNVIDVFERLHLFAVLDTLEYVKRGGRISNTKALIGNVLSVKPIISIKDGSIIALEQPRTRSKAFHRLTEIALAEAPLEEIIIAKANDEVGDQLATALHTAGYEPEVEQFKIGAALGTHAGPGAAGLFVITAKKD